jgi:Ras-related GTP-binding protein C/D
MSDGRTMRTSDPTSSSSVFMSSDDKLSDFGLIDSGDNLDLLDSTPSPEAQKPRVLIMGLRRSGKSSIQKVVFHKMSPNETLFLESSSKIVRDDIRSSSFVFFSIYNLPGQLDLFELQFDVDELLRTCDALVFVIDAQDEYSEALARLHETVIRALKLNSSVRFEVFVHKVDCLSDENKMEVQRDIQQRVDDDLTDAGYEAVYINFHMTSIYDHSIFEAFSKVVQKLIPQMATLESMLDVFISVSVKMSQSLSDFPSIKP